ncbi:ammonia-forming cytochrome c nitrite reductase subunit c552 [Adlercreutzia sp. R25]|uniref:nitrite reductase (cytochrome; ammonia-forming) n=1 Tax=Adlercreutzia shanghongiae TaxID=3111773 RepID=A0ABU6IZ80_9ACTN|nr:MULTISPECIES: ammonia-forming cytochrome c nitrite reductase subunit c552 [unclassified Adlercreutzia]MEC4273049.1 ammonia-forming cytochrome c nitrite reductase subunit c552 [Adlercreutzia sp. R25]MEC4295161.1 ammonia-forming cytochrome c nitrite reductase subunit c552 [Adlercreutzia sp. R22]
MKGKQKKTLLGASVVALCVSIAIGTAVGCAPQPTQTASTGGDKPAAEAAASEAATDADNYDGGNLDKWAEQFPLQYNSYHQSPVKADGKHHGHYDLKAKLFAPVVRDGSALITTNEDGTTDTNGDGMYQISGFEYDESIGKWVIDESELGQVKAQTFKMGCYSCKSGTFDQVLEQRSPSIFTQEVDQEFMDSMNGQIWACNICHGDMPGTKPTSTFTYFNTVGRDGLDEFSDNEKACGQCHNSLDYRHAITDDEVFQKFSAYKYGTDVDSLIKAVNEDDITTLDEEIGVKLVCFDHDEIEFAHTSPMAELGVDCVTCHMPQSTEGGTTYTNHHASGSPLENEDSLNKCLECHKSQGINSTDEMVKMVRAKQADATATYEAAKAKLDAAHDALAKATAAGKSDAELEQVRADYQTADGYLQHIRGGNNGAGTKVVHNVPQFYDLAAKASNLADGIVSALA